ncbi:rhodanese-like domain-containing protein [Candidatus Thiodiazotropha sp. LNASS1]|uniref:rhodanese-like domain-containing protein n=1 Tax=Candidatus Thiodiazotropha sp. LNASS1 TaxID=3096260 RepID=UPI0034DF30F6
MSLRRVLFPYLEVVLLWIYFSSIEAAQFDSSWLVDSAQLKELLQQQAKVVYVVKNANDRPSDVIPGTDIRRVLSWQPDSEGDSFAIRTFSNTLSYPDGKKYPKAMPTAEQWTGTMRRLGIDQNDTVIVVGNMEFATRFSRTVVEYGGSAVVYNDSSTENILVPYAMVDVEPDELVPGNFTAISNSSIKLSLENNIGTRSDSTIRFWDIRESVYPAGIKTKTYVYAQGTLLSASNALKFTDLLDVDGTWYQSADAISEVLNSHFGHPGRQEDFRHVIVCDSEGLSNIVMWVARSLGYENVFVLAGGLHEFTMYGDNHRYVNLIKNVD